MLKSRWLPLASFLLITALAAGLASLATASGVRTWYPLLQKPSWTPPSAVFAPVWTLLYIGMAVAAWRVWRLSSFEDAPRIVRWFTIQLTLNALWSILFFGLRSPGLALMDILLLWVVLVLILARFRVVDRLATLLWAPYVLWVTFAVMLNAAVWDLNR